MALPTKDQISISIEDSKNILDAGLSNFKTIDGIIGPECYSGGFCLVFPISDGIEKYAFRVWHTEIEGIKDRLAAISSYFNQHKSQYFVDFDFIVKALRVQTEDSFQDLEAIKMKWIEGKNLIEYIDFIINRTNLSIDQCKQELQNLANKFFNMVQDLHKISVSHGDLQHGNIMIDEHNNMILVDYDSVYVPSFNGEMQVTSGMAAYQHPSKKGKLEIASETDDYFSERIIYMSLLALAEKPEIWNSLKDSEGVKDEYSLIITEKDLENFTDSEIYKVLLSLKNPKIKVLCEDIEKSLITENYKSLCKMEDLFSNKYLQPNSVTIININEWPEFINDRPKYKSQPVSTESFDPEEARKKYAGN